MFLLPSEIHTYKQKTHNNGISIHLNKKKGIKKELTFPAPFHYFKMPFSKISFSFNAYWSIN